MENHDIDIRNLQFTSEDTGSFFSKTYTEYNWKFILDGVQRSITLYHSKILGRRTIYLGNQEICKYQRYTYNFQYSFPIETHSISIVQSEDSYILKIDEVPFNKLLNEQKLRRFNIIKDTFLESEKPKTNKSKKQNIKKFLTYNRGSAGIPISRRGEDRKNIFKTNIDNSISDISDVINNDTSNDIDTSTNKNNINDEEGQNTNGIALNQYYDGEEISDDISNMAIDGGDSDKEEDEDENADDEKTIQESFRPPADDDALNGNDENEDDENNINNINNINKINNENNNNEKEEVEEEEKEEDEEEEKVNKENYNNINNELLPIKSNRSKNSSNKEKIKSKRAIFIHNIDNNIDDENNINNINNINNNDHIDLLGEEIYNSSRDKNLYNNINNVDNNLNINYILSQKEQKYSNYKSNNPSNPFEDDSINTN